MSVTEILAVLGASSIISCIAFLLHYYGLSREDKGKNGFIDKIVLIFFFFLCIISFPSTIVLYLLHHLLSSRVFKIHDQQLYAMRYIITWERLYRSDDRIPEGYDSVDEWRREKVRKAGLEHYFN
jgi:hypothetical protein